jgi:lipopolysaccharide biosynthesis glycosyltransferase
LQFVLKVFVGYDSREDIAWQVCRHSLLRHAKHPIEVHAIRQKTLRDRGIYTRPNDVKASTEFSLTRFLTPYLAGYDGWSVFVDCDTLFTTDVAELLSELDNTKAVYVVKHEYTPHNTIKMDGKTQHIYPRKNWSSFVVFNGAHPNVKALTPDVVNTSSPIDLHRFIWTPDDTIGALSSEWNFLVGDYPAPAKTPKMIHYTNGGPWFDAWQDVDFADLWIAEEQMLHTSQTVPADTAA